MPDNAPDPENELKEFRKKWKQELKENDTTQESNNNLSEQEDEIESQARSLFQIATDLERKGQVYDAMQAYRKATHLVPDIDIKFHKYYEANKITKNKPDNKKIRKADRLNNNQETDEDLIDLVTHFQTTVTTGYCERVGASGTIFTSLHLSDIPLELLIYVLKWVVSSDLDFKSLENFGAVCKGFYLLARDPESWKIGCMKIWGADTELSSSSFQCWRDMYMLRPRIKFGGCYISKITYMRYGENSFQDQFYRPVQLVEYFRIIRFFPNGKLFMLTSADELQTSINKLKNIQFANQQKDILKGTFRLKDDSIVIIVKRFRSQPQVKRQININDEASTIVFSIELQIDGSITKKKFNKLSWINYKQMQLRSGNETNSEFELQPTKYPPFYYSRVKSFYAESNDILKV